MSRKGAPTLLIFGSEVDAARLPDPHSGACGAPVFVRLTWRGVGFSSCTGFCSPNVNLNTISVDLPGKPQWTGVLSVPSSLLLPRGGGGEA